MEQNKRKKHLFAFLTLCAAVFTVTSSCESEYTTVYNDIPSDTLYVSGDAYIKSFTVQEFEDQQPMQAAIVNDTIKVLWVSYYEMPETITPSITLADHASISPNPGIPVPLKTGQKYTVTSQAGTIKQYTLQVDFRQPQPKTFTAITKGNLGQWYNLTIGKYNNLDNVWFNLEQTRVYLVSAADQTTEYDCEIVYFGTGMGSGSPFRDAGIYFYFPTDMPEGKYDVCIKNGEYILRASNEQYWFETEITESEETAISSFINNLTVASGDTFSIRGTNLDDVDSVSVAIGNTGARYPLGIVTRTPYVATFKVPAGTPAAEYTRLFFVDGAEEKMIAFKLTVTE